MILPLLGLFLITGVATSDTTTTSTPSRHQMKTAAAATTTTTTTTTTTMMAEEQRRVFDYERLQAYNLGGRQQQLQQQQSTTDRRVIPWVSIAVLLNILFFFRSIAAPFFDPLVSTNILNCSCWTDWRI